MQESAVAEQRHNIYSWRESNKFRHNILAINQIFQKGKAFAESKLAGWL